LNLNPKVHLSPGEERGSKNTRMPLRSSLQWITNPGEHAGIKPQLEVFVSQAAYLRICAHAGSDLDNEVGGWLVGKHCIDHETNQRFIVIDTVLPGEHTEQGPAHMTFTGDSQIAMHNHLENNLPGKVLLGWYHTHPRMGVFLSKWDIWLHQNFFPEKWQVALVVEPHSSTGGFFIRQEDGSLDNYQYFGFYEILNSKKRSVVFWQNLKRSEEMKGESNNE
jgi:proteasome lid subunit RPN8/RPN11